MTEPKDAVTILREALQKLKLCALAVIDANNGVEAKNAVRVLNSEVIKANSTLEATERAAIQPAGVKPLCELTIERNCFGSLKSTRLIHAEEIEAGTYQLYTTAPASPSQPEASKATSDSADEIQIQLWKNSHGYGNQSTSYVIADLYERSQQLATPSPKPVAGEPVSLPVPLEYVRAKFRGEWDEVEAGDCYYSHNQMLAYGQAREDAALARQSAPVASAQGDALAMTEWEDDVIVIMDDEILQAGLECGITSLLASHFYFARAVEKSVLARLRGQKGGDHG